MCQIYYWQGLHKAAKLVPARYSIGPLFRRSAILKVHCADTCCSANVWVEVNVRVRVIGLGSALGLGLGLVGIVDFRNSGPSE